MKVRINGEPRDVTDGLSLTELLSFLKVSTQQVAVEVNAQVVRRALHDGHRLRDGDDIEIVAFVGGG